MIVWIYFLALYISAEVAVSSEDIDETSNNNVEKAAEGEIEETFSAVQKLVENLKNRITKQDEELKDLTRIVDYLKMAGPKLGVLELLDNDDNLGEISSKKHVERFTHVTAVSLRVPKKERSNVPKKKLPYYQMKARRNAVHVLVTVNTDKQIKLWDAEQNELVMVKIKSSAKVTNLLAASANQKAFLLAGLSDGRVLVYSITAWRNFNKETKTMSLEGHIKVFSNGELLWTIENKGEEQKESRVEQQGEVVEKAPAVSALGLNSRKHAKQFMVGFDNGSIRLYKRDGRMRKEIQTGNSTVLEIGWDTDRSSIPIFTDIGFRFMKLSGLKLIGGFCRYKEETQFTGYSFDTAQANLLYVAYSDGRLVLYDAKKLARKYLCKPKFEIVVESGSPLHLEATEGYLLASSSTTMYIFNTTDVSVTNYPVLVEKRAIINDNAVNGLGGMALTRDTYHHTLIVTTRLYSSGSCSADSSNDGESSGSSMVVYESYMKPKEKEKKEKGWAAMLTRTPILMIGLVFVLFMKFGGKGGNPLAKIFAGGRGRKRRNRRGYQNQNMMDMQRGQMMGMPPRHSF